MRLRSLPLIASAICIATPAAPQSPATDYDALLEEAVAAIDWEFDREWAFTETSLADEVLWVARFDPSRSDDERWTVHSVDGRSPTDDEIEAFIDDKETEVIVEGFAGNIDEMVRPGSLQLVEDADDYWLLSFVPDEDDADFADHVDGRIRIIKDGRYLESIEMTSRETVNASLGTRIDDFLTRFTFAPIGGDGPVAPRTLEVRIKGRALLVISFSEAEVIRYSDFERAIGD